MLWNFCLIKWSQAVLGRPSVHTTMVAMWTSCMRGRERLGGALLLIWFMKSAIFNWDVTLARRVIVNVPLVLHNVHISPGEPHIFWADCNSKKRKRLPSKHTGRDIHCRTGSSTVAEAVKKPTLSNKIRRLQDAVKKKRASWQLSSHSVFC